MPSRPVLIGRGLVTQTLNNHYKHTYQSEPRKRTTTVRVHIHHTPQHPAKNGHQGCVNQQLNTHMLGHPVTTPGCDHKSYGGHSERETPGPIPNPEVKPFSADGTATERLWESRTPPDIHSVVEATVRWPLLISAPFAVPTSGATVVAEQRRSQRPSGDGARRGTGRPTGGKPQSGGKPASGGKPSGSGRPSSGKPAAGGNREKSAKSSERS